MMESSRWFPLAVILLIAAVSCVTQPAFAGELKTRGLVVHPVKGDGNCLFRAVSYCLYGTEEQHRVIREACVFYERTSSSKLENFFSSPQELQDHIDELSKEGVWGSEFELSAISKFYDIPIVLYQHEHKNRKFATSKNQLKSPIRLMFDQNHFNPVIKKNKFQPLIPEDPGTREKNIRDTAQSPKNQRDSVESLEQKFSAVDISQSFSASDNAAGSSQLGPYSDYNSLAGLQSSYPYQDLGQYSQGSGYDSYAGIQSSDQYQQDHVYNSYYKDLTSSSHDYSGQKVDKYEDSVYGSYYTDQTSTSKRQNLDQYYASKTPLNYEDSAYNSNVGDQASQNSMYSYLFDSVDESTSYSRYGTHN